MRCCTENAPQKKTTLPSLRKIVLVGQPNVGKSLLFNRLTGRYVTVANYPGTTVEIGRGHLRLGGTDYEFLDTPGMHTLLPLSQEEQVAREILLWEKPSLVIHVAEARNLERALPLTFQLLEASLPLILVLNMIDEARLEGMEPDAAVLERELGIPVVGTIATSGFGIDRLKEKIRIHGR